MLADAQWKKLEPLIEACRPKGKTSLIEREQVHKTANLHLAISVRSFRAEHLSNFVGALIDGDVRLACTLTASLADYPLFITRDALAGVDPNAPAYWHLRTHFGSSLR